MSAFLHAVKEPVARKAIRYLKDHSRQSGLSRAWWPERRIGNGRALAHYAGLRPAKLEMDESVLRELAMG
jgi:hypothetical protein